MNKKKEGKGAKTERVASEGGDGFGQITNKTELKTFLVSLRDRMTDEVAPPIYAMAAMNFVMNLPDIYNLLDNENKEIARDIWLRLKQAGIQLRTPVMLFGTEAADAEVVSAAK